jgi:hypothetical protein
MILNSFSILDGFVSILRFIVALSLALLAIRAWRAWGRASVLERATVLEGPYYLLFLLASLLFALNLVSWPLLYLVLQSYVSQWPEVMCIYGVTQVGHGSLGSARFLPHLLVLLQVTKPAVVLASGAWIVLHLVNRDTRTAPLMRAVLVVVIVQGALAAVDALAESAYLSIPKKEEFHSGGCCTFAASGGGDVSRFLPATALAESARTWLWACYYGSHAGMMFALFRWTVWRPRAPGRGELAALFIATIVVACISCAFLIEIVAPILLQLPEHHCVYDLVSRVPEANLAIGSAILGAFSIAWACLVGWCAQCPETAAPGFRSIDVLLRLALHGYLSSAVLLSVGLAVA